MHSMAWKSMAMAMIVLLHLCSLEMVESSLWQADRITILPGQPFVGFQQFSGYVTVDDNKQKYLFYYFVEAEIDPFSKPLVLWLNGGLQLSSCFYVFALLVSLVMYCSDMTNPLRYFFYS